MIRTRHWVVGTVFPVFPKFQTGVATWGLLQTEDDPGVKVQELLAGLLICLDAEVQADAVRGQKVGRQLPVGADCVCCL